MLRLLPLFALALLPAAVAAPVPPGGRAEFGTNGLLTATDLEKVHFDTRPAKPDKEFPELKRVAEEEEKEAAKEINPAKARPKNCYDVAVHMPWAKFREGEPAPAYFVLRNNRARMLGLGSRMDLCGPTATLRGGECRFDIRDRATGKSVVESLCMSTNCGGDLVEVPADGFYCVAGDLNRLAGRALPPGEYEVDWRYNELAAAPVPFTMLKTDGAKPKQLAKRGGLHFLRLVPGEDDLEYPAKAGEILAWRDAELEGVGADEVAAALAVGPGGVYAPDVRSVPTADKLVEAWAEWRPYRDGDRVVVTLRAAPPYEKVAFAEVPQLHLQIETPDSEDAKECQTMEHAKKADERGRDALVTPLTVEARLPAGWRERAGAVRVAVLVTAKPIELPRGGRGPVKIADRMDRKAVGGEQPPVWAGVVRTDFAELRSPLPLVIANSAP